MNNIPSFLFTALFLVGCDIKLHLPSPTAALDNIPIMQAITAPVDDIKLPEPPILPKNIKLPEALTLPEALALPKDIKLPEAPKVITPVEAPTLPKGAKSQKDCRAPCNPHKMHAKYPGIPVPGQ